MLCRRLITVYSWENLMIRTTYATTQKGCFPNGKLNAANVVRYNLNNVTKNENPPLLV